MSTHWRRQFASLLLIVTLSVAMISVAQAATAPPNILSYQGRLLNANGVPVTSATASMKFKLYDSASAGTCLWSNSSSTCATETARTVTLSSGLFSENLGDTGASYAAIPNSVFADNATVYLGITIGADSEMTPRKRMTAAPYALNAQTLDGIDSTLFFRTDGTFNGANELVKLGGDGKLPAIDGSQLTNLPGGSIPADSLDFTDFADSMTLDAATTIAGNILSLNANSNFAVNINTGTSTGALSLGGGSGTVAINSSDWDIDATGAITGVSFDANGSGNSLSNIENADIAAAAGIVYSKLSIADSDLTIAKTSGLQSALDGKLSLAGGTLTGDVTFGDTVSDSAKAIFDPGLGDTWNVYASSTGLHFDVNNSGATTMSLSNTNVGTTNLAVEGAVYVEDGGVAGPTFTFTNDQDTGIYRIGSGNIGISSNSTKILDIGASGLSVTGTVSATDLSCTDCLDFTELADALTIDAATTITGTSGKTFSLYRSATNAADENGMDLTFVSGIPDGNETYKGLNISVTSTAGGSGSSNILTGLNIDSMLSAQGSVSEDAFAIGTLWDRDLVMYDLSPNINIQAASTLTFQDLTGTSLLTLGGTSGDLGVTGDITTGSTTFSLANAATTLNLGSTNVARAINIGTGTAVDTINIGTGGTGADLIAIGSAATAWGIDATGAAHGITLEAGPGSFTTLASTGTTTIGDGSATVAINSSSWGISSAGNMSSIGDITLAADAAHIIKIADQTGVGAGSALSIIGEKGGAADVAGGDVSIIAGQGGTNTSGFGQTGGGLFLTGGAGGAGVGGGGSGGQVTITGGAQTGGNNAGDVVINAGSGQSGDVSIGTTGTSTGVVTLGNSLGQTYIYSGESDVANWSIVGGLFTTTNDIALNGGDLTTTSATFNVANAATTLNLGSTNIARAINIGTGTGADTISIGGGATGADVINIGNNLTNSSTIVIGGSTFSANSVTVGASDWKVVNGIGTFDGLNASSSSFGLLTTTATTIDFGSAATTLNMQTASSGSFTTNIGNFDGGSSGSAATTLNVGGRGSDTIALGSTSSFAADTITIGNSHTSTSVTLDGGTLNFGSTNVARAINIGTGTAVDTINIGTGGTGADVMTIGSSAASLDIVTSGWGIDSSGQMTGIGSTTIDGKITITPAVIDLPVQDGSSSTQWGALLGESTSTVTYVGGLASESLFMFNGFAQPTLESSVLTTFTDAATMYIANAPAAGLNATITNPYALVVAAGNTKLGGDLALNGGDMTTSAATFEMLSSVTTLNIGGSASEVNIANNNALAHTIKIGGNTNTNLIRIGSSAEDGGNTASDTVRIATGSGGADTINIGNSNASTTLALTGGDDWSITSGGYATFSGNLNVSLIDGQTANIEGDGSPTVNLFQIGNGDTASTVNDTNVLVLSMDYNNTDGSYILVDTPAQIDANGSDRFRALEVEAFTFATTSTANEFSAIDIGTITVTSNNTSQIINGLKIANVSQDTTGNMAANAVTIGTGWDAEINFSGTAPKIAIGATGTLSVTDGTNVLLDVIDDGTVGRLSVGLNGTETTNGLCHSGGDLNAASSAARDIVVCSGAPGDYAEWHETDGTVQSGDIVSTTNATFTYSASESNAFTGEILAEKTQKILPILTAATASQSEKVLGVVSTSPNQTIGSDVRDQGAHPQPIALVGRVPVNVTNENGSIQVGDYITTSTTPGKGMKATYAGRVIGIALTGMNGASGQVTVQVTNSWYFGSLIGNDGTSTLLTDNVVVAPIGNASASTQTFDSYGLALRGSAWDGNQAQAVSMMFKNKVTDGTNYRLSVRNTLDSEVAYITNTGTMQVAGDMVVGGKIYPSNLGGIQTDKYIYYDGSAGSGGDFMRTNASGWSTGSYDFAEMFPSSEALVAGDVVVFSSTNIHVKRSTKKEEKSIAGIVSTRPGFLAGENTPGSYPIALAGRVPTNVNNENGAIAVGDPLTTSSASGVAMKATEAGPIVGYALEPFDGTEGSITVFVSAGYWGGDATSSTPGADNRASLFGSSGNSSMSTLSMGGNINMNGNEISNIGRMSGLTNSWSIEMDGTIKTEALLKTVIIGQNNQKVETIATTSPEAVITLSGSSTLKEGMAEVRFFEVNKDFGNVISAVAPIRVVATPNGPVSLYVSEKDQNHFIVKSFGGNASDVEFDWVVTGYRKGFEPVVEEATPVAPANIVQPSAPSITHTENVDSIETTIPISPVTENAPTPVVADSQANTTPSEVPASSPSASTTTVDPSVTNVDAPAPTLSP